MQRVQYLTAIGLVDLPPEYRGDAGAIRVVPDQVARDMVTNKLAIYLDEAQQEATEAQILDERRAQIDREVAEGTRRRPYGNESKADWIAWAIDCGEDEDMANKMTKADLMSKYGERL